MTIAWITNSVSIVRAAAASSRALTVEKGRLRQNWLTPRPESDTIGALRGPRWHLLPMES